MAAAARAARIDLETLLRTRKLDNTLTSALPLPGLLDDQSVVPTGIAVLDARLHGGVPRGQVSEIVGPRSSGRASLLCSMLAGVTARGEIAALVDTLDMFDAASAAACRIELGRLLWIRGEGCQGARVPAAFALRATAAKGAGDRRGEAGRQTVSQRATARSAEPEPGATWSVASPSQRPGEGWDRVLDRAIKALNLVLQAGGFGLVALDLAEVPPAAVRRLPFTTWLRLQRVIEGSHTACLLVSAAPVARSAGGVTIALQRGESRCQGARVPAAFALRATAARECQGAGARWLVTSGQWSVASGQLPVASGQCVPRDQLATDHWPLTTDRRPPTTDHRRARLFLGLDVEARLSRARWPETGPCRFLIGAESRHE